MAIFARCSRCHKRILPGTVCECRIQQRRQSYAEYDRTKRDKVRDKFYHSAEWIRTREEILSTDHMDLWLYAKSGIIQPADTVHHIVPLSESWERRCDPENLISLSNTSHNEIEAMYKEDAEKKRIQAELFDILERFRGRGGSKSF